MKIYSVVTSVLALNLVPMVAAASGPLLDNAVQVVSFPSALTAVQLKITFDGTHYYACSGGGPGGVRIEKRDVNGLAVANSQPNLDCRSIRFRNKDKKVYASSFSPGTNDMNAGIFSIDAVALTKTKLYSAALQGAQNFPIFDASEDGWLVLAQGGAGAVNRYKFTDGSADGVAVSLLLQNAATEAGGLAAIEFDGEYYYTFDLTTVRAYKLDGSFAGQAAVPVTTPYPVHSLANGLLFVFDTQQNMWRGFSIKKECVTDADCDNADMCDGAETCSANFKCVAGEVLDCDDGILCTGDSCDADLGCVNDVIDGCCTADVDCDDADMCNGAEVCDLDANTCSAGMALECADVDACTQDSCDPQEGCINAPTPDCCDADEDCAPGFVCDVDQQVCIVGGTTGEPATTTGEPATTTGEPATTTGEPATTTGEPATTTGEPPTTSGEPPTTDPTKPPTTGPGEESSGDGSSGSSGGATDGAVDDGGCGCRTSSPRGVHLLWALVPLALRRRRARALTLASEDTTGSSVSATQTKRTGRTDA